MTRALPPLLLLAVVGLPAGCYESGGLGADPDATEDPFWFEVVAESECGNGVVEGRERCDDGDDDDCNGCTSGCEPRNALHVEHGDSGARIPRDAAPCFQCPFTVEAWIKIDEPETMLPIIEQPGSIGLAVGLDRYHYYGAVAGSVMGSILPEPLEPGDWHHVAWICYREDWAWMMTVFVNGLSYGGGGSSGPRSWDCDVSFLIGNQMDYDLGEYSGAIDDLRITDDHLYIPEDTEHMYGTVLFTPERYLYPDAGTVAFWDFDDVDEVIRDRTGNGHDARIIDGRLVPDECHLP